MIVDYCPAREIPDFLTLNRTNGTIVELGYNVKKTFREERSVDHLKEIYANINVLPLKFLHCYYYNNIV